MQRINHTAQSPTHGLHLHAPPGHKTNAHKGSKIGTRRLLGSTRRRTQAHEGTKAGQQVAEDACTKRVDSRGRDGTRRKVIAG
jgi:hypothetical protein